MPEVRWVHQEEPYGCGCAAVAMATGMTYAEVRALIPGKDFATGGMCCQDYEQLLACMGYATAKLWKCRQHLGHNYQTEDWPPAPFADVHICEVYVKGGTRGSHMVVMLADGTILDPVSPEPRTYADYERIVAVMAVVPIRGGS
jgi:hypothetical protein